MHLNSKSLDFIGFPNYSVFNDGQVVGLNSTLLPSEKCKGYLGVTLYNEDGPKTILIHKLVALAFVENPNNEDTVDHIDNNNQNNLYTNLQWMSRSDNAKKGWSEGNHDKQRKKVIQLNGDVVIAEHASIQAAADSVGVNRSGISRACSENKVCKGFRWIHAET